MAIFPVNPTGLGNPNPYFLGLNTVFNATFASIAEQLWHAKLASVLPMSSEVEGFGWTDPAKRAREWAGARQADQPAPRTYFLTVKPYEKTMEIDKFAFTDDKFGLYSRSVADVATMLAKEPDFQLRDLILNLGDQQGAYQKSLDGLNHWDANHPVNFYDSGYGVFNNDYRGATGVGGIGGPLAMNAYVTARYDMMQRKGAHGEVLGIRPNLLVSGPTLEMTARQLLNATFLGLKSFYGQTDNVGPAENMVRGSADYLMIPDLGSSLDWLLLDTSRGNMPFTVGTREMGVYAQRTAETDPVVFDSHKYLFGGYSRFVVGWGHPILSSISGPVAGV
jgi:phage major head subunit gpT-like protein